MKERATIAATQWRAAAGGGLGAPMAPGALQIPPDDGLHLLKHSLGLRGCGSSAQAGKHALRRPAAAISACVGLAWRPMLGLAAHWRNGARPAAWGTSSRCWGCCALTCAPSALRASAWITTAGSYYRRTGQESRVGSERTSSGGPQALGAMAGPQMQATQVRRPMSGPAALRPAATDARAHRPCQRCRLPTRAAHCCTVACCRRRWLQPTLTWFGGTFAHTCSSS